MPTNLAQARRNYYGGNTNNGAAQMDSGTMYYNANGSRTGARIDGSVKRKTMMGGASQGPISTRLNRSDMMENEAKAEMEKARREGQARAQAEAAQTARPANGYDVPVGGAGKPAGYWKEGRYAGSQVYVPGSPPATSAPGESAPAAGKSSLQERLLLSARRTKRNRSNLKALQDRNFSRYRADIERNPEQYPESTVKRMTTGMAEMREEARRRGELNTY